MQYELSITLPHWLQALELPAAIATPEERMALVLQLAENNILQDSGGPFAAAIFEQHSGRLLAVATNQVVPGHCSIAHAEILAIGLAQQQLGSHTLHDKDCQLVCSAEPCAMCTGAIGWSGLASVVYGACKEDVEAIGFDEGHKPKDWAEALAHNGTTVYPPLLRKKAAAVLQLYHQLQGLIYNP